VTCAYFDGIRFRPSSKSPSFSLLTPPGAPRSRQVRRCRGRSPGRSGAPARSQGCPECARLWHTRVWQRFATKWAIRAPMSVSTGFCEKRLRLSVRARGEADTHPAHSTSRLAEFAIRRQLRTQFAFWENPARERKAAEHRGNAGLWLIPGTTAPRHLKRRVRVST
jgi:hypothetical protein